MPTESVEAKAGRFLDEGRVEPYSGIKAFAVQGDSDSYMVVVGPDVWFCSCPATVKCSHVVAAERWWRAEQAAMLSLLSQLPSASAALEELSGYVQRLADRKHHEEVGA